MAGSGAAAMGGNAAGNRPQQRDRKQELAGTDGFSADNGNAPTSSGLGEAAIDGLKAHRGFFVRASGGDEGGVGGGAGGCEVAESAGEGFAAGPSGRSGG